MNLDRIKKSLGERVQLLPPAISLDGVGQALPPADDVWIIEAVSDDGVRVSNTRTHHRTLLGKDHIHHYTTNPDATARTGIPHGFFTLNVQVYLRGANLTITPTQRPGKPVPPPNPMVTDLAVDINYPSASGLQQRLEAAGYRLGWARESLVPRRTNLEGWSVVIENEGTGQPTRYRVKDRVEDLVLLMRPANAA